MKTKLTILCLLFSTLLMAQVTNLPTVLNLNISDEKGITAFGVVPRSLSYDGSNRVYVNTAEDQIAIYSNSFTPVKQFSISPTYDSYTRIQKERMVTVTVTTDEEPSIYESSIDGPLQISYLEEGTQERTYTYNIPSTWTTDDIQQFLNQEMGIPTITKITDIEGGILLTPDWDIYTPDHNYNTNYYQSPDIYGKKYPLTLFLVRDGFLYYYYPHYRIEKHASFSYGEWEETSREIVSDGPQNYGLGFINYDTDQLNFTMEDGNGLCLTQTLFNEDNLYEYLYFPISSYKEGENYSPEEPICENCYSEATTFTQTAEVWAKPLYTSFEVMSETGSVLQSVSFPNGFVMERWAHAQIVKLSDEYYIVCMGKMGENYAMLVYKINRTNSGASVQQVSDPQKISGAFKFIRNGHVFIQNADKTYTITGAEVK